MIKINQFKMKLNKKKHKLKMRHRLMKAVKK